MLEKSGSVERNGHIRPLNIVFIGSAEQTLKRVTWSIHLCCPMASTVRAPSGADGLQMVKECSPDLVLVHTDVRDMFPQALVEELREFTSVPIVVLTSALDDTEAAAALELGADDYLQFPCGVWQLTARIWAVLRRCGLIAFQDEKRYFLVSGRLSIDPAGVEVFLDNRKVDLTLTEFRLLYLLAKNHGKVVTHDMLEKEIWGGSSYRVPLVRKHIQRLRRKLGDSANNPRWVANVSGLGYRFIGPRPRWHEPLPGN